MLTGLSKASILKRACLLIGFLAAATFSWGKEGIRLSAWSTATADRIAVEQRIDGMLNRVDRSGQDLRTLRVIFRKTQREFLRHYKPYAAINELSRGTYDCLTATSLFVEVLDRTGFRYRIIETTYHIFLMVNTTSGEVLLETTDRFGGLVVDPEKIQERIAAFKASPLAANSYRFNFDVFREISAPELDGLLYFNQAVNAYNARDWKTCAEKIQLSASSYSTPRIKALATVLLQTIAVTDVADEDRDLIRTTLKEIADWREAELAAR